MLGKEIPVKNYVKYALIVIFTLTVCIVTFVIYNNQKDYENNQPILRNKVPEITVEDIESTNVLFEQLMGSGIQARKKFIKEHSKEGGQYNAE